MTKDEIHNIYLHMSGKVEGLAEATGSADFPVMFAEAILAYAQPKRPWVGLTAQEAADCWTTSATKTWHNFEAALKEKNT